MKRQETLQTLCELATKVGEKEFQNQHPTDCFCGLNRHGVEAHFQFSESVMAFIVQAVEEKLNRVAI